MFTTPLVVGLFLWKKKIVQLYLIFYPYIHFVLGNDNSIEFWKDIWWGDTNFASLYPWLFCISSQKNAIIAEILSNSTNGLSWNLLFSRRLYDWEVQTITALRDSLHEVFLARLAMDKRIWILESSRTFSSKSFFRALSNSPNIETTFSHRLVGKLAVPPRVKAFPWTAAMHRINTMDMLKKKRPFIQLSPQWYSLCKKDGELVHHIFLHCSFTYEV